MNMSYLLLNTVTNMDVIIKSLNTWIITNAHTVPTNMNMIGNDFYVNAC